CPRSCSATQSPRCMRHTRSAMLQVLSSDYVRTARAKGLPERRVVLVHGLRNALMPVITLGALDLGTLLSGAVLTEQVFTIPGFGKLIVDAVFNRDYAVVQGVVLCAALAYVLLNLVAPYDPLATDWLMVRKVPSAAHWFGTDEIGRDVLARIVWGSRASLLAGLVSVSLALAVGVPLGLVSGYLEGVVDATLMRLVD